VRPVRIRSEPRAIRPRLVSAPPAFASQTDSAYHSGVIRLLVADDSAPVIRSLRALLESAEDVRIVGEAKDFDEAFRLTETLRPDVLLMELNLPGSKTRMFDLRNLAATCACPVVAMSFAADFNAHKMAATIGAVRLLDKVKLHDTLIQTLCEVVRPK
jgi:chemotaxis response regulator CheB